MLIASESGHLYSWNPKKSSELENIFFTSDYLMGLTLHNNDLYVGSRNYIYKMNYSTKKIISLYRKGNSSYHHIDFVNGHLYATATRKNEIHCFSRHSCNIHKVTPPDPSKPIKAKEDGGVNYNHINKIFWCKNKFYVNLNWLTKQYGPSGVAVYDKNFKELDRFEYGWQSHGFCYINDIPYTICAATGSDHDHPSRAGLMVDGELVFEHDYKTWFCKDFSANDNNIILAGGQINKRNKRKHSDGVLYVLDRNFNKLDEFIFPGSGGFKGILLEDLDYTKSYNCD